MVSSTSLLTLTGTLLLSIPYAYSSSYSESLLKPSTYSLGDPIRDDFDCQMRYLALEYAEYLQSWRPSEVFGELADALNGTPEKASDCTVSYEQYKKNQQSLRQPLSHQPPSLRMKTPEKIVEPKNGGLTYFVDGTKGSDSNNGTVNFPFRTISTALAATRQNPGWDTIVIRQGTYYITTITLTTVDNGLTIQAYPGEEVWLSGAVPLQGMTWQSYNTTGNTTWVVSPNENAVYAEVNIPSVWLYGQTNDYNTCEQACILNNTQTGSCNVWTWHDQNQGQYALQCYFRNDGAYNIVSEPGHVSGHLSVPPNIWMANMQSTGITSIPGLRYNGRRMIRARYPNANPEINLFLPPFTFTATSWTPQSAPRDPDVQIDLPASYIDRNTSVSMFQTFTSGIGGTCDRFQPNAGYWCSNNVQGGGSVIYYVPTAMQATSDVLPNLPYKNATNAVVQTWRPGHWASWMYVVGSTSADGNATNFTFSSGGFQGSRGENGGEDTYIENVFEELDAPAEWYYDEVNQILYFWFNATSGTPPPSDGTLLATQTKWLFNITGTQANPVTDITLLGLGLRDTAYTYMDPHSIPSGGDWTLERSSVVFLEGTEHVTVSGCVFDRVDGNAVLLSAYNRNASIVHNEFMYIGATAVAAWGNTENGDPRLPEGYGADGSSGNQPRHNTIAYNLCHELGIWEKQSSFYTQFKASENWIHSNIVFNGPRAHINYNDGYRGGSILEKNLIFNSCRESGDHGPFNSWDRDPYIFDSPVDGSLTTVKTMENIRNNFIIANYNSLGAIDNDDGSSYYLTTSNFFVYGGGGLKNDFEGHDNVWAFNIVAYANSYALHNGYGGTVGTPGNGMKDDHVDMFYNNTVVLPNDGTYALPICSGTGKTVMSGNTLYTPTGNVSECGMLLSQWQAQGNDLGTVALGYPSTLANDIIGAARSVLFV